MDTFPPAQQSQIRIQLSTVLHTVISQQLLPDQRGGLVPAYEIMHMNSAIRSLIRDSKNHQIDNAIASGSAEGMVSMDQSILELYRRGAITMETALGYADNPDQLQKFRSHASKNRSIIQRSGKHLSHLHNQHYGAPHAPAA